ncbi:hypothetical protein BV25DRAFT_1913364 [Artomyces pyxidatus]|uniref:Uncharacterized protein n=1 Tax=Artomyces pyxidatus TaxID=48021 RepID=A0ACB8TBM1_9AGAM|nr:hypothetical protein BV25DRAFT_1913364 [Artomyces pyxidatus]
MAVPLEAARYDKEMSDSWNGNTEGILVVRDLSYGDLQRSADLLRRHDLLILAQRSQQLAAMANGSHFPTTPLLSEQNPFQPTSSALRVNAL